MNTDLSPHDPRTAQVLAALRSVADPCSIAAGVPIDLVDMGLVESVEVAGATATIVLWPTSPICMQMTLIRAAVEEKVSAAVPGVREVVCRVEYGSEWHPSRMAPGARTRLRTIRPART